MIKELFGNDLYIFFKNKSRNLSEDQGRNFKENIEKELLPESEEKITEINEEENLLIGSLSPYLNFFLSLFLFLFCIGISDKSVPNSLIFCGIALFFTGISFVELMSDGTFNFWGLTTILFANFISFLPVLSSKIKFSIGKRFIWRPFFSWKFGAFRLNFGLASLSLFVIPIILFLIALRKSRQYPSSNRFFVSFLKFLLPYIICLIWSNIAFTMVLVGFKQFSITNLLLAIALLSFIVLPNYIGATLACGILFSQIKRTIDFISLLKIIFTIIVFLLLIWSNKCYKIIIQKYKIKLFNFFNTKNVLILFFVYLLGSLTVISFLYQSPSSFDASSELTNLTWPQFENHCAMNGANQIHSQMHCSQMKGMAINWKGTVQSVRISDIDNSFETLLDYLPDSVAQAIRCFYDTDSTDEDAIPRDLHSNECSLAQHNHYTYELEVSGPYGEKFQISGNKGQLLLTAQHTFGEILRLLDEGDIIRFIAFFDSYPVFRYPPRLRLLQLECLICKKLNSDKHKHLRLTSVKSGRRKIWARLNNAFELLFNFVFAPFILLS
uniref:Uncharacterized protein n=1 Tax=Meloidogyne enterolobii TaxID=390850 RepID=A0A6V7WKT0_MELEN|nr:unnamed protein product [Meloidogyne enterolobii]